MRIYIAGPMTGLPALNFPAFHEAAAKLRAEGHDVVNPAEINAGPAAEWAACMRADIRELMTCDAVYLLPSWERSKGAALESHIAMALGMKIMTAPVVRAPVALIMTGPLMLVEDYWTRA
jgi:hypothetical protein